MTPRAHLGPDLGFLNSLWWDVDLGKGVHGPLDWIALDPWHRVQGFLCQTGFMSQGIQDCALLLHNKRQTALASGYPSN